MNRQTKTHHRRRHRKAKTNSLVLVLLLLISLLCYLSTTTCGVVSALTADEVAAKYPDCNVSIASAIGNGYCDGGRYNTEKCGWDGGDCLVEGYPDCHVDIPSWIGNGYCHGENITPRTVVAMVVIVLTLMRSILIAMLIIHPTLEMVNVMKKNTTPRSVDGMGEIVLLQIVTQIVMLIIQIKLAMVGVMEENTTPRNVDGKVEIVLSLMRSILIAMLIIHP